MPYQDDDIIHTLLYILTNILLILTIYTHTTHIYTHIHTYTHIYTRKTQHIYTAPKNVPSP
jgi:hypothetical protein